MKHLLIVFFILGVMLFSGCASITQDIKVDAVNDPKAKFSGYKTYQWAGAGAVLNDPEGKWQPPRMDIAGDIKYLIDRELRRHNIFPTTADPDLQVGFFIGVDMESIELQENPGDNVEILKNIPKAGLVVFLKDVETGYVIWLGSAEGNLQQNPTEEVVRKRLDFAVRKMFKLLPDD